jgi:hypothetical protein
MNTHDLPPAAKLAALIEAGRAANPDMKQRFGGMTIYGNTTCALGFAALGAGIPRDRIAPTNEFFSVFAFADNLWSPVARMNDAGSTLDEIIHSLREGELAKVSA